MNTLVSLIKRNILIYLRDRTAVFFSLLSMIIVIGLMILFLGNMNKNEVVNLLGQYGSQRDADLDAKNAEVLIQVWTIAGLLVVNALTVSLTMIGTKVEDEAKGRLASFYVAPIRRSSMAGGYVVAAMLVASFICFITLGISQLYLFFMGSSLFTGVQLVKIAGIILANSFTYTSLLFLVALFVHSTSAWAALETIMGTLVGFVGAIYLPMGMLPDSVQSVLKCLPILHGISLMRKVCTEFALENTFSGLPGELSKGYQSYMGITVEYKDELVSSGFSLIFLLMCGIIALILSSILMKRRALKER
ncbi:ABC transporter permease [Konateibacter massiliensis]|uniref:ABC transporter permease n=1 Tax=Konateibacter massiliensis TaxID=2002841 RepID=UPI000C159307|nr:ABC transporter permease [Konateibacter massiliensis]